MQALESWLHPRSHPHLKFLASDFIGMFKLSELVRLLDSQVSEKLREWDRPDAWEKISLEDKGWMLNYVWASSRCEEPMYHKLERLLANTEDPWIEEWILFVPRQMPDQEFCRVIENYLNRERKIEERCLELSIIALAALKQAGAKGAQEILIRSAHLFSSEHLIGAIEKIWRRHGFDPVPIVSAIK